MTMKPRILIEVRGGIITFILSNTDNIEIVILDHDWEESQIYSYKPDSIMTDEGLDDYIKRELKEEDKQ